MPNNPWMNHRAAMLIVGLVEIEGKSLQEARFTVGFMDYAQIESSIEKLILKQDLQLENQKHEVIE